MAPQIDIRPKPIEKHQGCLIASARLDQGNKVKKTLWFQIDERYGSWLTDSCDPWVLAVIFTAMRSGADLIVHGAVSASLINNLTHFQEIWTQWKPNRYHRVRITAEAEPSDSPREGEAIQGFTGGIDSCFTALRHRDGNTEKMKLNLTAGLTVLGFDIPLSDRDQFGSVAAKCRSLLQSVGMEALTVITNIREQPVDWRDFHGAALASTLNLLSGRFAKGVIASTLSMKNIKYGLGSHPLTDPLLGSAGFPIIHDGTEWRREEKARFLAGWPEAMSNLRVCWEGKKRDQNCGHCYKCTRTKLCFMVNGLPVPSALGLPPTESEIRSWPITEEWQLWELEGLLETATRCGQAGKPWFITLSRLYQDPGRLRRRFGLHRARRLLLVNGPRAVHDWFDGMIRRKTGLSI